MIPVDVRIIAATNKDLLQETVEGRFREDLYYRLDVLDLKLPPLRERGDDVKILGLHLFRQLPGGKDPIMQSQFLYLLEQVGPYQWYGNIRELQNFVERANILMRNAGASSVTVSDILRRRAEPAPEPCQETESRDRRAIEAALHNHPGSMADAARSLGCSRQTLWRKMKNTASNGDRFIFCCAFNRLQHTFNKSRYTPRPNALSAYFHSRARRFLCIFTPFL